MGRSWTELTPPAVVANPRTIRRGANTPSNKSTHTLSFPGSIPDDCVTDGMVATDSLENYRATNRRVATLEACEASLAAETSERDRKNAAVIVNAMVLLRMTPSR
jgi:hypothetical protein